MNCPACSHSLKPLSLGGVTVDVCDGGCGGVWFDKRELDAFDEPSEFADPLLGIHRDPSAVPDGARHHCPSCTGIVMMRHFFSTRFEVEVDECPGCGGFWLDHGELEHIRAQFDSADDRQRANEAFLARNLASPLASMDRDVQDDMRRAHRLSRLFRWACPSAWIPGKQPWGSF